LKYGSAKFSVEILEYCEPSEVFKREQYYFDLVKPEYNILKTASPFSLSHLRAINARAKSLNLISKKRA
jgi:group I intron endonuclease